MSNIRRPRVLAICGATGTGKSEIAVMAAELLGGEIVNADSRQVYSDLSIGTSAPSAAEVERAPHHLFQFVDPCERYSAGAYARDAHAAIVDIETRGKLPIVVGGTGLYIEALGGTMPMDRIAAGDEVRARVRSENAAHPQAFLHGWLHRIARDDARRVPEGDRYRTLRALESALAARLDRANGVSPRDALDTVALQLVILEIPAAALRARIDSRARAMFSNGIDEEAVAVWRRCPDARALTGLGYAEALAWRRGEMTRAEAIASTVARTLRYAKRQRAWFRRMTDAPRIDATDARAAAAAIARIARENILPA